MPHPSRRHPSRHSCARAMLACRSHHQLLLHLPAHLQIAYDKFVDLTFPETKALRKRRASVEQQAEGRSMLKRPSMDDSFQPAYASSSASSVLAKSGMVASPVPLKPQQAIEAAPSYSTGTRAHSIAHSPFHQDPSHASGSGRTSSPNLLDQLSGGASFHARMGSISGAGGIRPWGGERERQRLEKREQVRVTCDGRK